MAKVSEAESTSLKEKNKSKQGGTVVDDVGVLHITIGDRTRHGIKAYTVDPFSDSAAQKTSAGNLQYRFVFGSISELIRLFLIGSRGYPLHVTKVL